MERLVEMPLPRTNSLLPGPMPVAAFMAASPPGPLTPEDATQATDVVSQLNLSSSFATQSQEDAPSGQAAVVVSAPANHTTDQGEGPTSIRVDEDNDIVAQTLQQQHDGAGAGYGRLGTLLSRDVTMPPAVRNLETAGAVAVGSTDDTPEQQHHPGQQLDTPPQKHLQAGQPAAILAPERVGPANRVPQATLKSIPGQMLVWQQQLESHGSAKTPPPAMPAHRVQAASRASSSVAALQASRDTNGAVSSLCQFVSAQMRADSPEEPEERADDSAASAVAWTPMVGAQSSAPATSSTAARPVAGEGSPTSNNHPRPASAATTSSPTEWSMLSLGTDISPVEPQPTQPRPTTAPSPVSRRRGPPAAGGGSPRSSSLLPLGADISPFAAAREPTATPARALASSTSPPSHDESFDVSSLMTLGGTISPVPDEVFDLSVDSPREIRGSDGRHGATEVRPTVAVVAREPAALPARLAATSTTEVVDLSVETRHEKRRHDQHAARQAAALPDSLANNCSSGVENSDAPASSSSTTKRAKLQSGKRRQKATKAPEIPPPSEAAAPVAAIVVNWGMCDKCNEWRIVPCELDDAAQFACADVPGKSCGDPPDELPACTTSEPAAFDEEEATADVEHDAPPTNTSPLSTGAGASASAAVQGPDGEVLSLLLSRVGTAPAGAGQDNSTVFEDNFVHKIQRMLDWRDADIDDDDSAAAAEKMAGNSFPQKFLDPFAAQVRPVVVFGGTLLLRCGDDGRCYLAVSVRARPIVFFGILRSPCCCCRTTGDVAPAS